MSPVIFILDSITADVAVKLAMHRLRLIDFPKAQNKNFIKNFKILSIRKFEVNAELADAVSIVLQNILKDKF